MSWIQALPLQEQNVHRLHPLTHNDVICLLWLGRDVLIKVVLVPDSHSKLKGKCYHEGVAQRTKRGSSVGPEEELEPGSSFSLSLLLLLSLTPSLTFYHAISSHIFFCSSLHKLHSLHFHIHQGSQVLELDVPQFIQLKLKQYPKLTNDSQPQFLSVSTLFQSAMMRYEVGQGHII